MFLLFSERKLKSSDVGKIHAGRGSWGMLAHVTYLVPW